MRILIAWKHTSLNIWCVFPGNLFKYTRISSNTAFVKDLNTATGDAQINNNKTYKKSARGKVYL